MIKTKKLGKSLEEKKVMEFLQESVEKEKLKQKAKGQIQKIYNRDLFGRKVDLKDNTSFLDRQDAFAEQAKAKRAYLEKAVQSRFAPQLCKSRHAQRWECAHSSRGPSSSARSSAAQIPAVTGLHLLQQQSQKHKTTHKGSLGGTSTGALSSFYAGSRTLNTESTVKR